VVHVYAKIWYIHAIVKRIRTAVAGATGYAGMTTVNLLSRHPNVDLVQLASRSYAGKPAAAVFPFLHFPAAFVDEVDASQVDAVFACLPHGASASRMGRWLQSGARVIDLSADFRLSDPKQHTRWYQQEHPALELLPIATPGSPELYTNQIRQAQLVAVPGCHATAAILALAPAAASGLVGIDVIVDSKTGVSGAGRSPSLGVHFSEVAESAQAYSVTGHRHLPEVIRALEGLASGPAPQVTLVTHLVPMVRGILATCYFALQGSREELEDLYQDFYVSHPFVHVVPEPPATKLVSHTNHCAIHVSAQGPRAVVVSAIDNLMKGAAGQAVECFNLAFGLDRCQGLEATPQWP
jgi:N-acetyl-gamma-glutamyl-phosphate reductase